MNDPKGKAAGLAGIAIIGCLVAGVAGLLVAFLAVMNDGNYTGASAGLVASALAFGLGANAVFRQ